MNSNLLRRLESLETGHGRTPEVLKIIRSLNALPVEERYQSDITEMYNFGSLCSAEVWCIFDFVLNDFYETAKLAYEPNHPGKEFVPGSAAAASEFSPDATATLNQLAGTVESTVKLWRTGKDAIPGAVNTSTELTPDVVAAVAEIARLYESASKRIVEACNFDKRLTALENKGGET
jgi:hypothetical protein